MSKDKTKALALQRLLEEKRGGKKRVEYSDESEEEGDTLLDEEYERNLSKNWIEGDYEEDYGYDEDEEEEHDTSKNAGKKKERKKTAKELAKIPTSRIDQLFLNAHSNKTKEDSSRFFNPTSPLEEDFRPTKRSKTDESNFDSLMDEYESALLGSTKPKAPVTKKPAMEVISTSTLSYDVNEEDQPLPATQPKENITSKNKTNNTPLVTSPKIESSPVKHVPHLVKSTDPITQGSKPSNANEAKAETPKPIISNSQPSNLVSPPIIRTKQFNNSTWAAISKKDQTMAKDTNEMPTTDTLELPPMEEGFVHFYWTDIYEDQHHAPGRLYLFGKIFDPKKNCHSSCAIFVNNIQRTLYISPRKRAVFTVQDEEGDEKQEEMDVDWKKHVLPELHEARQRSNITKVGIKGELVERQYHFDVPDVPQGTSKFIELIYGYDQPAFDAKVLTGNSYAYIFGSNTSATENFIMQRKIMGPCWLKISGVKPHDNTSAKKSWCLFEGSTDSPSNVEVAFYEKPPPTPKLVVASIKVQVVLNQKEKKNEIVAISCVYHDSACESYSYF